MTNKYCNLDGTKKIREEYPKITNGFAEIEVDINNLSFTGSEHDALVTASLVDAENVDFGSTGTGTYLNGRLGKWETRQISHETDFAKQVAKVFNIDGYGADPSGVADSTTFIQATIDAAGAAGGGIVDIPIGTYLVTAALTITNPNITIQGAGKGSKILTSNATADIFTVGDGTNSILNIIFRDLCLDSSVAKTDGWAIDFRYAARCKAEGVWIEAPEDTSSTPNMKNGINFNRFDYCRVENAYINVNGKGIQCNGNEDQSFGVGLFLGGGTKIFGASSTGSTLSEGVHIGGASGGVYFDDIDIIDCGNNVYIADDIVGVPNREVFFSATCSLDSPGYANIVALDNAITHLDLTGTWIASSGASNPDGPGISVVITQPSDMIIKMVGVRFFNNRGGAFITNSGSFIMNSCVLRSNGQGANGGHGIHVANDMVTNFVISNNDIIANGTVIKGIGIFIEPTTTNNYVITGNLVRNNAQAQITDNGLTNKVVVNNLTT